MVQLPNAFCVDECSKTELVGTTVTYDRATKFHTNIEVEGKKHYKLCKHSEYVCWNRIRSLGAWRKLQTLFGTRGTSAGVKTIWITAKLKFEKSPETYEVKSCMLEKIQVFRGDLDKN